MELPIASNLLRWYLRNAYFINGTAYAGKSTAVKTLAERYDMIFCGENYHDVFPRELLEDASQPGLRYFDTMSGWPEFLNRSPEKYAAWIDETSLESAQIEVLELIHRSAEGKKLIVDTNLPVEWLRALAPWEHVAIMLNPQSMSVERFFDRADPEKQFLLRQIQCCPDPEATMANFRSCIDFINRKVYTEFSQAGFFTLTRDGSGEDTREQVVQALANHFGFTR